MNDELSLNKIFHIRYGSPRIQLLLGVISATSLIYLTSDLWKVTDSLPFPEIVSTNFWLYLELFLGLVLLSNIYDISRLTRTAWKVVLISLLVTLVDLFLVSSAEYICLVTIGVFPQDYIQGTTLLLLGALPASLGSIVLSSLTVKLLKERSKKLYREVKEMRKDFEDLQTQQEDTMERIKQLQKKNDELIKETQKDT